MSQLVGRPGGHPGGLLRTYQGPSICPRLVMVGTRRRETVRAAFGANVAGDFVPFVYFSLTYFGNATPKLPNTYATAYHNYTQTTLYGVRQYVYK